MTENADGTASITYRTPSAVFAPYRSDMLGAMAKELDPIFGTTPPKALRPLDV